MSHKNLKMKEESMKITDLLKKDSIDLNVEASNNEEILK